MLPVLACSVAGGALGTIYVLVLEGLQSWLLPDRHGAVVGALVLLSAAGAVAVLERRFGPAGSVELLVDNIHVSGGTDDPRPTYRLLPLSLICISAGGALGPEAPMVQASGTLGSAIGFRFRLRPADVRVCTITAMASALAVLLGAPLGAAFFALEILHRRGLQYYEALLPAVIGSLSGYAIHGAITGLEWSHPWTLDSPLRLGPTDLLWAAAAGVLAALLAAAFAASAERCSAIVDRIPAVAAPFLGAAGLILGARVSPFMLTNGETQMELVLAGTMTATALVAAAAVKLSAVVLCLVTRWKGGFIIPMLFVGAAIGAAIHLAFPSTNQAVLITAMMAALVAGVTKTPIGSTLMVTEMSNALLLPTTLIAVTVALLLTPGEGVIPSQRDRIPPGELAEPVEA